MVTFYQGPFGLPNTTVRITSERVVVGDGTLSNDGGQSKADRPTN